MATPFHRLQSVHVKSSAPTTREKLLHNPGPAATDATATTLAELTPFLRGWGLRPTRLPTVTAPLPEPGTVGTLEVRWSGRDDETAWPAMTARLLVVPTTSPVGSRVVAWTHRSPATELTTTRLGSVHRHRVLALAMEGFLREMASQALGAAAGTVSGEISPEPLFVHHIEPLHLAPVLAARALRQTAQLLGDAAATAARADLADVVQADVSGPRRRRTSRPRHSRATPREWFPCSGGLTRRRPDGRHAPSPWPSKRPVAVAS